MRRLVVSLVLVACGPEPVDDILISMGSTGEIVGSTGEPAGSSESGGEPGESGAQGWGGSGESGDESTGGAVESCEVQCLAEGWFCQEAYDSCSGAPIECDTDPTPDCPALCECGN